MTLDGRIASRAGNSRWISGEASRRVVHELRGRVDGILVGRRTAELDDPLLTARPAGPRTATRIVLDSQAALSAESQLAHTARDAPVLVATSESAPSDARRRLESLGCEILTLPGDTHRARLQSLLIELGRRRMTNLLVEGGAQTLGSLFDADQVDEVHAFIAPKLIGGGTALGPVAGDGRELMAHAHSLERVEWSRVDDDLYVRGLVCKTRSPNAT
jgi:diaminohydroxyphosphoribosylaminopyrimidine deaminase/5-amino-6-(5-phosphoribosylamino)uracil reductase